MEHMSFFEGLNPVVQAFIATLFTWFLTALGAGIVFFFKTINRKLLDAMLGFAAGVMIAASYWSLLAPAIEMAEESGGPPWVPATIGFLAGGVFLWLIDKILPHLHVGFPMEEAEGISTNWRRSVLLVLAITIHNIPEGLAVGVAFGALAADIPSASLAGAVALAIGIGIQNFPEGAAVSVPLRREGFSRFRAFWYGQLSGVVEPVAGVLGAVAVIVYASSAAVRVGVCGRRDDLRRRRGTDTRVTAPEKYGCSYDGCHAWVCRHDDPRCGPRVIIDARKSGRRLKTVGTYGPRQKIIPPLACLMARLLRYIHPHVSRYAQVDVPCRQTIIRRNRVELFLTVTLINKNRWSV